MKPASQPTLEEIARLLRADPALNVILVRHTDNQGTYDDNIDLSLRRAEAWCNVSPQNPASPLTD